VLVIVTIYTPAVRSSLDPGNRNTRKQQCCCQ